jgi:hypothetical protein
MPLPSGGEYLASSQAQYRILIMQKSLFEDAYNAEGLKDAKILEIRKRDIGILCREQLLKYFVDDGTVSTMRRWVSASPLSI